VCALRLNLEIQDAIYERLRAEAKCEGRSISDVVRSLVNVWLASKALGRKHYGGMVVEPLLTEEKDECA